MDSMRKLIFMCLGNSLPCYFDKIRYLFYKCAGVKLEGRCHIWGPITIKPSGATSNVVIGSGSFLNTGIRFGVPKDKVTIGRNVQIGPGVMFETVSHDLHYKPGVGRGISTKPIFVQDEVWIGAGTIVTQGVTIGRGAVVAAGSVVTRNVESMTLVAGVPASVVKTISPSD
jgi:maltose O-acetyltransferase